MTVEGREDVPLAAAPKGHKNAAQLIPLKKKLLLNYGQELLWAPKSSFSWQIWGPVSEVGPTKYKRGFKHGFRVELRIGGGIVGMFGLD